MATIVNPYNHTAEKLLALSLAGEASNIYLALSNATTAFDGTHTTLSAALGGGADEVSGNGWPVGGVQLTNFHVATVNLVDARINANPITVSATGGAISAASGVIYVDVGGTGATKWPLWHIDFGESIVAPDGVDFQVVWHTDGIATIAVL